MQKPSLQAWWIWFLASLFALYQFFLQVCSSMMTHQYGVSFHINHTAVGWLSSAFFYGYVLVQIPVGLLLDHYNVRRVLLTALLICVLGSVAFASSTDYAVAIISRVFMGIGAGFAFVSMVFVSGQWFPRAMFALLVGMGEFIGMAGTGLAERFVPPIIVAHGWRVVMYGGAFFGLVIFVMMLLTLSNHPAHQRHHDRLWSLVLDNLKKMRRLPKPWLAGVYGCGLFAVVTAFSALWGVPFLEQTYGFGYVTAAEVVSASLFGIAIGGPVIGAIAGRFGHHITMMLVCSILTIALTLWLLFSFHLAPWQAVVLLFGMGFFASSYVLAFAVIDLSVVVALKGTAIGVCNTLALLGAVISQPLTGWLLTHLSGQGMLWGNAFRYALLVLPVLTLLALLSAVVLLVIRDRYDRLM